MIWAVILGGVYFCFSFLFAAFAVVRLGDWEVCLTAWDYTQRLAAFLVVMVGWPFFLPMIIEDLVKG